MNGRWTPHDLRDEVVDFVAELATKTELPLTSLIAWTGVQKGKFYDWRKRYGKVNEHNGQIPRDHWITDDERKSILAYHERFPMEGYRRLTFMMLDDDVVAVSPSTTYRVLSQAGLLDRWSTKPSTKGTGFEQPLQPHDHWITDDELHTSTSLEPSTTCAQSSTAVADSSSTGTFASP